MSIGGKHTNGKGIGKKGINASKFNSKEITEIAWKWVYANGAKKKELS